MVKLGVDHPYHVLYQLLSLQNGDRDKYGHANGANASSKDGLQQTVDIDKIQAATLVIQQIAATPSRYLEALPFHLIAEACISRRQQLVFMLSVYSILSMKTIADLHT